MTAITKHILRDGETRITILSAGCAVQRWQVGGKDVVLGYRDANAYISNPGAMGAICGRVANRIRNARFELDGQEYNLPKNDGPNHLHGGFGGLSWRNWEMTPVDDTVVKLRLISEDCDQGYPGRVVFDVHMRLEGQRLTWDMTAEPDRATPINLAQHVYFNFNGAGTILNHKVQIDADRYTPNGPDLLPLGLISSVAGTEYDFRKPVKLEDALSRGWDGNVVLARNRDVAAEVTAPDGLTLRLRTDRPCVQIYTSNSLRRRFDEGPGASHVQYGGLCLEAQDMPNAVNEPAFGSIIYGPGNPYRQVTSIEIV